MMGVATFFVFFARKLKIFYYSVLLTLGRHLF